MTNESEIERGIDAVLARIRDESGVTMVEAETVLSTAGIDVEGRLLLTTQRDANLVMWSGCSETFVAVMSAIAAHPDVRVYETSVFSYVADGLALDLPIAVAVDDGEAFQEPHWIPTAFDWEPRDGG